MMDPRSPLDTTAAEGYERYLAPAAFGPCRRVVSDELAPFKHGDALRIPYRAHVVLATA